MKKFLAFLLSAALLLGMVPAAADVCPLSVSLTTAGYSVEGNVLTEDAETKSTFAVGDNLSLIVTLTNTSESALYLTNLDLCIVFDDAVLTGRATKGTPVTFDAGFADFDTKIGNISGNEALIGAAATYPVKLAPQASLRYFVHFTVNQEIESTDISFAFRKEGYTNQICVTADAEDASKAAPLSSLDLDGTASAHISGIAPTLGSVALAASSVTVSGGNAAAQTVQASAASEKGTALGSGLSWSVEPADKGVTVDENGLVSVSAKASAGSYTVKAVGNETDVKNGDTDVTAALTVTRDASVLYCVELDKTAVTVNGSASVTVTAAAKDQFGDAVSGVTYSCANEDVSVSGAALTVAAAAKAADAVAVTAEKDGKSVSASFSIARSAPALQSFSVALTADAADVPKTGTPVTITASAADAVDQYGDAIVPEDVVFSLDQSYSGVSLDAATGVITVTNEASRLAEGDTVITVSAAADGVTAETATLTLHREAYAAASVTITNAGESDIIGVQSSKTYTAAVKDQYGYDLAAQIDWTLSDNGAEDAITCSGSTVSVADRSGVDGKSATLTASCGEKNDSVVITAKGISLAWDDYFTAKTEVSYGADAADAFSAASVSGQATAYPDGVSAALNGTFAVSAEDLSAGEGKTVTVTFTVTDEGVYRDAVLTKEYSVTVLPLPVTVEAGTYAIRKTYDGTAAAGTVFGALTVSGILPADDGAVSVQIGALQSHTTASVHETTAVLPLSLTGEKAGNYTVPESVEIPVQILPAEVGLVWANSAQRVYNGQPSDVTAEASGVLGTDVCTVSVTGGSETDAGTYTATAMALSNTNYCLPTAASVDYRITKAARKLVLTGAPETLTLYPTALSYPIAAACEDLDGSAAVTYGSDNSAAVTVSDQGVVTAVGNGTATVTVSLAESKNYTAASATLSVRAVAEPVSGVTASAAAGTVTAQLSGSRILLSGTCGAAPTVALTLEPGFTQGAGANQNEITVCFGSAVVRTYTLDTSALIVDARSATVEFVGTDESRRSITYTCSDVGKALPQLSRSGYTFNGWTIRANGAEIPGFTGAQTAMTDALLTALSGKSGLVAEGSFTVNGGGGGTTGGGGGMIVSAEKTVSVEAAQHGSVTADKKKAPAGESVTLSVKAEAGYRLGKLTVTGKNGKEVAAAALQNGTYRFEMPAYDVTVRADFVRGSTAETCKRDGSCLLKEFGDLELAAWYHNGVHYCVESGLMKGTGNGSFEPGGIVTRGTLVTILYRIAGEPEVGNAVSFADAAKGAWYEKAVVWAGGEGIVNGYGSNLFGPDDAITREQLAAILYRYAQYALVDTDSFFADTNTLSYADVFTVSDWAKAGMNFCVAAGIINGSDGMLNPGSTATRAEAATMIQRFCEKVLAG